jgi:hypothetical protein
MMTTGNSVMYRCIRKVFVAMKTFNESGQGVLEYSLAIVLIAILVMVTLFFIGPGVVNMLTVVVASF